MSSPSPSQYLSSSSRSLSFPPDLKTEIDDLSSEMDDVSSLSSSLSSFSSTKISKSQKSTMSSLSRSLSFPSRFLSFLPDLKTQTADQSSEMEDVSLTTDFIAQSVNEHSGKVEIVRSFHKHPLILSTYLNVDEKVDEFNFCCFCKIYFTVGVPIYSCVKCYMFLHESCAELPMWIDSTRHPQHRLLLTVTTTYEDCVHGGGRDRILTSRYECRVCDYDIDINDALQSIPISLFKNTYLNLVSSSLPLYSNKNTTPPKEEDLSITVSRKVDQIDHFFHEHPLILSTYVNVNEIKEENERCTLCENYFCKVVPIYSCNQCNFFLHESCAQLPQLIKSTLHPQHLLDFTSSPTEENLFCDKCYERIDRSPLIYKCGICDYNLHFECVLDNYSNALFKSRRLHLSLKSTTPSLSRSLSFPMDGKRNSQIIFSEPPPNVQGISLTISSFFNFQIPNVESVDQIRHFSHRHPLVFMILIEYRDQDDDELNCQFCNDVFLPDVPFYGCHECAFYLHKSCAELPQTMRNTFHPAHMLQLIKSDTYPWLQKAHCQTSYCYCCIDCRVYLDCKCAPTYNFEEHKEQEHTFHFVKASLFTCDACGITENEEHFSNVCTKCPLQVHVGCSNSFPHTVKQIRHHHKLKLTYSFESDSNYANETCRICFNQMSNVYCMYQCADCTYIAHVSCATSKDIVEHEWIENKVEEFVTREDVEGNEVKHFSHPHDLIFTNKEPMVDAYCDACVSSISAPFYACAIDECNFYLHKQCFELPSEIQHPLHEHRLALISWEGFFTCYVCNFSCNGFMYYCTRGCRRFNIDVRCSLLSDTLNHDSHECTLILIDYTHVRRDEDTTAFVNERKCSACDSYSSWMFSCRKCEFDLELGCALLPKQVTHECPNHDWKARPLELRYGGVEDKSGEYYCDGCEESRCIRHWFYDCGDCVWSNHPQCLLGKFQYKYGITYQYRRHHHKLKLVKKDPVRFNVYSCDDCKKPLTDDSPAFCAECNLYFHIDC